MTVPIIEHIAAGGLRAVAKSPRILQAYLGTCLGVALYDDIRHAGGLIHILLPEPPGMSPPDFPEKYAATGIPLLIKALEALGCRPENLRATIAGGALVGPASRQDMGLDIGGRSVDIAQNLLGRHGIEIVKSETGGFFVCTLELDLATGRTRITPALDTHPVPAKRVDPPTEDQLAFTIDHLKPIPQTALKILRMVRDHCHDIGDVTRELATDQVLSAQTLKLCNSVLFAGTLRVDTLRDAVLLLGEDTLIRSVIAAAVEAYYNQAGTSGYSLCRGGLFFHAVGVAILAEALAQKTEKAIPQQAYTAGLLHDIGKVVLDQFMARIVPLLFRELSRAHADSLSAESKIIGTTHCKTGALLAKKWQFSTALTQVIRYHHRPEEADSNKDLVAIVYLADLLMEKFFTGVDLERNQTVSLRSVFGQLALTPEDIVSIMDKFPLAALTRQRGKE